MSLICQQCSAEILSPTPFCPRCSAPQISVSAQVEVPENISVESDIEEDESFVHAPLQMATSTPGGIGSAPPPIVPGETSMGMDTSFVRSRALLAAGIMILLTFNPWLGGFALLWVPLCGALAVFLCQRHFPQISVAPAVGAKIGLRTAMLGFAGLLILTLVGFAVEHFVMHHSVLAEMRAPMQSAINSNPDPQVRQMAQAWLTQSDMSTLLVIVGVVLFFIFLILGAVGGAVQSLILHRHKP